MTLPTRDQLDAVLTRSSAGVSAMTGDLDDPDERALALDWLEKIIAQATQSPFPPPAKGSHESDLFFWRPSTGDDWNEWSVASHWSRTPDDRSST